ncbi:hypothetical protein [Deinococcus aestuarii]|uniref:hypothetical protein n=1 Tax=Deinococcus aestuarii TaxID=2774531 RepID=UPI001C0C0FD1|nr:hypothetical protein [Deinococcus aestuarii]
MTAVPRSPLDHPANRQSFETCIALTLQVVAAVEFASTLGEERPTRELLLSFAEQVERNARDIAVMAGHGGTDLRALGEDWYGKLAATRDDPLAVAYHALHSAAYLGLEGGATTATVLAAVGYALRVLARREGRLSH